MNYTRLWVKSTSMFARPFPVMVPKAGCLLDVMTAIMDHQSQHEDAVGVQCVFQPAFIDPDVMNTLLPLGTLIETILWGNCLKEPLEFVSAGYQLVNKQRRHWDVVVCKATGTVFRAPYEE